MDDAVALLVKELRSLKSALEARPLPLALTKTEAARLLSMSKRQLERLIARGEISTCVGDARKVPRREVERYSSPAANVVSGAGRRSKSRKRVAAFDAEAEAAALRARR